MNTCFAATERATDVELATEIDIVSKSMLMSGVLNSISGLLAVLDEHRQIVSLNDSFLEMLGIVDPAEALGLRPGEALRCIHADDETTGCGTTKYCSSCGAAIAIVASLEENTPIERICFLSIDKGDDQVDLALLVNAHPVNIDKNRFLLIFLQDITQQQQRAALERTFFHDVNNMLSMILGASELLLEKEPSELAKTIHQACIRLNNEIHIQRCLSQSEASCYQQIKRDITTEQIIKDLHSFFDNHPVARGKNIDFQENYPRLSINIDVSLLSRVLCNMIINALEATGENDTVKIWIEKEDNILSFCVWNGQEIPHEMSYRIFQRNFSTKEQDGRGIGTFSMKLFGEKILGGKVSFTTSRKDGTTFTFAYPI